MEVIFWHLVYNIIPKRYVVYFILGLANSTDQIGTECASIEAQSEKAQLVNMRFTFVNLLPLSDQLIK